MEDASREIDDYAVQIRVLGREEALGADHTERLAAITKQKAAAEARLAELQARWEKESGLVNRIREVRGKLEGTAATAGPKRRGYGVQTAAAGAALAEPAAPLDIEALRTELASLNAELEAHQGETPLMRVCVDAHIVGEVVSGWTGIPVGKMLKDEVATVLALESHLGTARHRAGSRAAHDQRAHPHFESQPGRSQQAHRRVHAGGARAASEKPRPRWRSPTCFTAASAT